MFKDLLTNHKVPVAVTAVGLLLTFGLAIAPSLESNPSGSDTETARSAAFDDVLRSTSERGDTLQTQQDALAAQLSALQEQVRTHDLAIGRTFSRLVKVRADAQALADMLADADTHGVQISTLNRAVTRLNLKINDLSAAIETQN